jgi:alpha-galactosidase
VANFHSFKDVVWHGDQYRLVNPHENDMASLMYVTTDKRRAVMFNYFVSNRQRSVSDKEPVKLNGLDPKKKYVVKETNLYPGSFSPFATEKVYSGDFLMKAGINPVVNQNRTSVILEINEVQ